jgi:chromosome partitioning protein
MFTIVIASPKGGAGKSTLTINLAGMLAARKQRVVVMDLDKQRSATGWLARRPVVLPKIVSRTEDADVAALRAFAPKWMVVDTQARLRRGDRAQLLARANVLIVPVNPSVFDIEATAKFLIKVQQDPNVQSGKVAIALIGIRTDSRTRIAKELASFFDQSGLPVIAYIPDSVLYPGCANDGTSIFDLPRSRAEQVVEAWQPITAWLKTQLARAKTLANRIPSPEPTPETADADPL